MLKAGDNAGMNLTGNEIKALVVGFVVDIGGTIVASLVLSSIYAISLVSDGLDETQIREAMENIPLDSWFSIVSIVVGAALSVLGGFVCARIARATDYRLGVILALCSSFFGLVIDYDRDSGLAIVAMIAVTIVAVLAGTRMGLSRET